MVQDEDHDSDVSENEEQYSKLANAVSELDSTRRVRAPTRKELSSVVSEYHIPKQTSGSGDQVSVKELANLLTGKLSHINIGKKVKRVIRDSETLRKPLEKPVADKIKRIVGYLNVQGQLKKWNAVVQKNRAAEHLSFPLQAGRFTLQDSQEFLKQFKTRTPLEKEMYKILGEKEEEDAAEPEDEKNKNLEFPLTLEEILEKKKELARIRAKMSYQEAKAHRQSKIKSKKYHRLLKREKIKQEIKEFEQLVKSDPEAALKKLEALDKSRAQERASLRHKNTGKWARNLAVRAKYDKDSRKVLAEQLKLSRDLTEKVKNNVDSDEDVSDEDKDSKATREGMFSTTTDNPWALNVSSEVSDFVSGCKNYWKNLKKTDESNSEKNDSSSGDKKSVPAPVDVSVNDNAQVTNNTEVNSAREIIEQNVIVDTKKADVKSDNKKTKKKGDAKAGSCKDKSKEVRAAKSPENRKSSKTTPSREKALTDTVNGEKSDKKSKLKSGKKKVKPAKSVQSTLGSWTVTELDEKKTPNGPVDIDDIFDELEEKIENTTTKKLKKVKKKLESKKNKVKKEKPKRVRVGDDELAFKKMHLKPELDEELGETTGDTPESIPVAKDDTPTGPNIPVAEKPPEIDPNTFIDVKPQKLNTKLPDPETDENYMDDEENPVKADIVEAFVDDDVMDDFEEMKKEEEESSDVKVSEGLPGWGSWGGADIKPSERKKKRNMLSVPAPPPKKIKTRKDMIVREKGNQSVVEHMVKDIPYPFETAQAFEASIREPVGREWIPETAHRKFIKPSVETQLGVVIDPMDENELLRQAKDRKPLYRGKKKEVKK